MPPSTKRVGAGPARCRTCCEKQKTQFLIALYQTYGYGSIHLYAELWRTCLHPDTLAHVAADLILQDLESEPGPGNAGFYRLNPQTIRRLKHEFPEAFATPIVMADIR